ncbi:MAG: 2OG-Fe(II) oxygenase family protein, partial [Gammaproteobacteria bacterium]
MELDIVSYDDLINPASVASHQMLEMALLQKGIVGVKDIPEYEKIARNYIHAARQFTALDEAIKQQYAPNRDTGDTEGYEAGVEKFINKKGEWQIDDQKISYYAYIPTHYNNKWPTEVELRAPYMALGELIFRTGKQVLNILALNETAGLRHDILTGHCRMLHYRKESDATYENPDWCGAHFDHSIFTGLIPAYYFCDGQEIDEPAEAGLYIKPTTGNDFKKIHANDKSILLFQVGEFGQFLSHDRIRATEHIVKKAKGSIDRYTFALFYSADDHT